MTSRPSSPKIAPILELGKIELRKRMWPHHHRGRHKHLLGDISDFQSICRPKIAHFPPALDISVGILSPNLIENRFDEEGLAVDDLQKQSPCQHLDVFPLKSWRKWV
jgi:hypothetical protein